METTNLLLATEWLFLLLFVIIIFYMKARKLAARNSNIQVMNILRAAKLEFEILARQQPVNMWEEKWIEPFYCLIKSGIQFARKCNENHVITVKDLNRYIGDNRHKLKTKSEKEFAEFINNELPFEPLPVNSPFPESLQRVQDRINIAIEYGNFFNNPFSCFIHDYLKKSREMSKHKMEFKSFFGMSHPARVVKNCG